MVQISANDLPIGTIINSGGDSYKIIQVLGAGGFGIAYKALDIGLEREVALKEYFPFDCAVRSGTSVVPVPDPERRRFFDKGLEAFLLEALALAKFDIDNIVKIYKNFKANGTAYFVMPLLQGQSLDKLIGKRRFREEEALEIILPILDGLKIVHKRKLLHLDIKPANIYLATVEGLVKPRPTLIDFGAARRKFGVSSQSVELIFTPGYAPLEQYSTKGNVGPWTDIYALCATLYEMLSGVCPPEPNMFGEKGHNQIKPLHKINSAVSEKLSKLIMQGLAIRYQERPQTIDEFLLRLEDKSSQTETSKSSSVSLQFWTTKPLWRLWLALSLVVFTGVGLLTNFIPMLITFSAFVGALLFGLSWFSKHSNSDISDPIEDNFPPQSGLDKDLTLAEPLKLYFRTESSGHFNGMEVALSQELLAGRDDKQVNIVLKQSSISGKHAKFSPIDGRPGWCRASDLGSRNKTYYALPSDKDGWQIIEGGTSVELPRGSLICLASEQTVVIELR
jgi:serine/threonine protein kinase